MTKPLVRPGSPPGSTVLFLASGRPWTADEAVADAMSRGALDRAVAETLAMAAAESEAEVDLEALQKKSDEFRYEHDLISAGETEEWLAARGLTTDDYSDWLTGQLSLAAPAGAADKVPDDFTGRLFVHLWLSGEMDRIADDFRRRIAAQIELANENLAAGAAHDRIVRGALTPDARRRKLDSLRTRLTRIEVEWLELDSEAAAREATLCVRNDGATLAEVAADAGFRTKHERMWAEDAGSRLTPQAPFAAAGDLVGPLRVGNGFKLCQIVRRIEPSLDDRDVAARVDSMLLDEAFTDLVARHTQLPVTARTTQ